MKDVGDLERQVTELRFIPFLGAGASSLRRDPLELTGIPWGPASDLVNRLFSCFEVDSSERNHLLSFLASNGVSTKGHSSVPFDPKAAEGASLLRLQVSLVRLSCQLTGNLGRQIDTLRPAPTGPKVLGVPLSHEEDSILFEEFVRAVETCDELIADPEWNSSVPYVILPMDVIRRKIAHLGWIVLGKSTFLKQWLARCKSDVRTLKDSGIEADLDPGFLRLDEAAWLTEVLWLTIRREIQAYPTSSELACRISLEVTKLGPRTGELAQSADYDLSSAFKVIQAWFKFCQGDAQNGRTARGSTRSVRSKLHLAVACALKVSFDRYQETYAFDSGFPPKAGLPVAFTTNYDRELELAFDRAGFNYHVMFPAQGRKNRGSNPAPFWMLKNVTHNKVGDPSIELRTLGKDGNLPHSNPPTTLVFKGPLIVKLHGSPLEELPSDRKVGEFQDIVLSLVVAESEYLHSIIGETAGGLEWLKKQTTSGVGSGGTTKRRMWFLGYSVSDWNVRLRLYEQISSRQADASEENLREGQDEPSHQDGSKIEFERDSVNRPVDILRRTLLEDRLEIRLHEAELLDFADELIKVRSVGEYYRRPP